MDSPSGSAASPLRSMDSPGGSAASPLRSMDSPSGSAVSLLVPHGILQRFCGSPPL